MFKTLDILAASLVVVRQDGRYVKTSEPENTRDKVEALLDSRDLDDAERQAGEALLAYAKAMPGATPYARKVRQLASRDATSQVGVLASVAGSYLRDAERQEQGKGSTFIGQAGDKLDAVRLTVADSRTGSGRFGTWYLYKFRANCGGEVVWFASNPQDIAVGDAVRLSGRVKGTDTYKGVKQTTVTRCSIEVA